DRQVGAARAAAAATSTETTEPPPENDPPPRTTLPVRPRPSEEIRSLGDPSFRHPHVITAVSLGTIGTTASSNASRNTIAYAHPDASETSAVKAEHVSPWGSSSLLPTGARA